MFAGRRVQETVGCSESARLSSRLQRQLALSKRVGEPTAPAQTLQHLAHNGSGTLWSNTTPAVDEMRLT